MKKLIILAFVLVLLLANTLPAVAKRSGHSISDECGTPPAQAKQRYALAGWIIALNADQEQVSVWVAVGNTLADPCVGTVVTLDASDALLKLQGGIPIDFEDLAVEQPVSSNGYLTQDGWSALQITVGADLANKVPPAFP